MSIDNMIINLMDIFPELSNKEIEAEIQFMLRNLRFKSEHRKKI